MEPKELSISDLLQSDQYIIPLYQRNYAWGEIEITQLLQDVFDKFVENPKSHYYIGTLIVDKRLSDSNIFEIIDGQQRHTTITLINAVIKGNSYHLEETTSKANLLFDARDDIKYYIDGLYSDCNNAKLFSTENIGLQNIKNAIRFIEDFLSGLVKEKIVGYFSYFYNNVKIIRFGVPKGTDINHYFEVMNNRGEQLEKHEILKAKFFSKIDLDLRKKFALVWDACSQMNRPIQLCFSKQNRDIIFGNDLIDIPEDVISKNFISAYDDASSEIGIILSSHKISDAFTDEQIKLNESKFTSVIDFPNFLLQVLATQDGKEQTSLDDKNLLNAFRYPDNLPDPVIFINSLLFYRVLFDKYIIKREEANDDWSWCLLKPSKTNSGDILFRNTFGRDDTEDALENGDFIMLQSMLHVSFPSNNYKTWLKDVLAYFKETKGNFSDLNFKQRLTNYGKKRYEEFANFGFDNGTSTSKYLFNYLDYFLWKEYNEKVKNTTQSFERDTLLFRISNNKNKFSEFKFSRNNSVEHVAPQKPIDNSEPVSQLHSFGNLCLISSSTNSRIINLGFNGKKEYFKSSQSESLKQAIIFSYDNWTDIEIEKHQNEMLQLLEK